MTDGIEACRAQLENWCIERGHWVSPDGRVHEDVAAEILGIAAGTLRNQRCNGASGLGFYRAGGSRGRITYRLTDLARHIEASRADFFTEVHESSRSVTP